MSSSQLDYQVASLHPRLSDWRNAGLFGSWLPTESFSYGPGEHILTNRITFQSGQVIRGVGMDATTLVFPQSLYQRYGKSSKASSGNPYGYSWGFGWIEAVLGAVDIGLESAVQVDASGVTLRALLLPGALVLPDWREVIKVTDPDRTYLVSFSDGGEFLGAVVLDIAAVGVTYSLDQADSEIERGMRAKVDLARDA